MPNPKRRELNALKHGLFSQQDLMPDESIEAYGSFMDLLIADLDPAGPLQIALALRIAGIYWRLGRIPRLESALYGWRYKGEAIKSLQLLSLYESRLDRQAHRLTKEYKAMKESQALKADKAEADHHAERKFPSGRPTRDSVKKRAPRQNVRSNVRSKVQGEKPKTKKRDTVEDQGKLKVLTESAIQNPGAGPTHDG